jgi:hypothetical protein
MAHLKKTEDAAVSAQIYLNKIPLYIPKKRSF